MEIVEGHDGIIVIDPLISIECAAAGLALYREHRGDRPVAAVVYTHSHVDHFGGVAGVVSAEDVDSGRVPILAPEGFLEHAVRENAFAGPAMARRAGYMYGAMLERGPREQVGCGLGLTTSVGRNSLYAPTVEITETGQEVAVDGIRFVFQLTPGTEAPAEMNFHFPDHRVLCVAENATTRSTTSSPRAARWSATRMSGPATSTRRSSSSVPTPTCSSPSITGRSGAPHERSTSSASSATSTATSTTKRFG